MVSCTFGGGTVRPEFEILTGMTTSMLPSGNVPYQQYVFNNIYSYAREFKNQGYDTIGNFMNVTAPIPCLALMKCWGNMIYTQSSISTAAPS